MNRDSNTTLRPEPVYRNNQDNLIVETSVIDDKKLLHQLSRDILLLSSILYLLCYLDRTYMIELNNGPTLAIPEMQSLETDDIVYH